LAELVSAVGPVACAVVGWLEVEQPMAATIKPMANARRMRDLDPGYERREASVSGM